MAWFSTYSSFGQKPRFDYSHEVSGKLKVNPVLSFTGTIKYNRSQISTGENQRVKISFSVPLKKYDRKRILFFFFSDNTSLLLGSKLR